MKSNKEEIKKEFIKKSKEVGINPYQSFELWEIIESIISQTRKEVIEKVESKLYTENGFFREDDGVAPGVQGVLQDIKLDLNKK